MIPRTCNSQRAKSPSRVNQKLRCSPRNISIASLPLIRSLTATKYSLQTASTSHIRCFLTRGAPWVRVAPRKVTTENAVDGITFVTSRGSDVIASSPLSASRHRQSSTCFGRPHNRSSFPAISIISLRVYRTVVQLWSAPALQFLRSSPFLIWRYGWPPQHGGCEYCSRSGRFIKLII